MQGTRPEALKYDDFLEAILTKIEGLLTSDYGVSRRSIGLLLLEGDPEIGKLVKEREKENHPLIEEIVAKGKSRYSQSLGYIVTLRRQQKVKQLLESAVTLPTSADLKTVRNFREKLSRITMNPITGIPILLIVLYFGLYQFVGVLGAGTLVNFLEKTVFKEWVSPWITGIANNVIPWQVVRDLFVGQYGIITLGMSYAIAIIFPIVGTFFLFFSVVEDSGYLPRLAMLVDGVFKWMGLSGRAVIPMVLGFGCDTMATIVTRTQETKRERVITTLLLALAIPCSAQLGVVLAILSGSPAALLIWVGVTALVLLLVGFLAAKIMPGKRSDFYMEVPPLRMPKLGNVLAKTYTRLQWYFLEVLPLFVLASVIIWIGNLTGAFAVVLGWIRPLVQFIGLPPETANAFLFGFFRRDFGAAGLYDLHSAGILTGIPMLVAAVTLTLFIPCVAQFSVMLKERGVKTAIAIAAFVFPFAFAVGFALNFVLIRLGAKL